MSQRVFEGAEIAEDYAMYRPSVPDRVMQEVMDFVCHKDEPREELPLVVDVGCGSGQFTQGLASHFNRVLGFDVSEAQIKLAKQRNRHKHVEYGVFGAEALPVQDGSVDLVTASSAAHWFDIPAFIREVERVLRPGGCVAILGTFRKILHHADQQTTDRLRECRAKCMQTLDEYRVINEKNGLNIYEALDFPGFEMKRDSIGVEMNYTAADYIKYVRTISYSLKYTEKNPDDTFFNEYEKSLRSVLPAMERDGEDAEVEPSFQLTFWYDVILARKPLSSS